MAQGIWPQILTCAHRLPLFTNVLPSNSRSERYHAAPGLATMKRNADAGQLREETSLLIIQLDAIGFDKEPYLSFGEVTPRVVNGSHVGIDCVT